MTPTIMGFGVAVVAIISATVAVGLGHIDSQTYATIVGAALGGGLTFGAHASGVTSGAASAAAATPAAPSPPSV